ncbi:MAG: transglutaminase domain-containing protein [Planctomycetes bacterium]|nr:transglutaminase domain-containing protein [Planctomycetota bacterium]
MNIADFRKLLTLTVVIATVLLSLAATQDSPSGRPPMGPLQRVDPRLYDFGITVNVSTTWQRDVTQRRYYNIKDAPIVMPVIFQGTYSRVPSDSLWAKLWLDGREDKTLSERTRVDSGFPYHSHLAVMTIPEFNGQTVRWSFGYKVQLWSSKIDDAMAANIPWPREWPKEVKDGLKRQMFIESDEPIFKETIERISQGQLRMVPPYLAAKDIVKYCIENVRVSGNSEHRGYGGMLHGLQIAGALKATESTTSSANDLVCVCVAMLRAAGIPARPVIGIEKSLSDRKEFVSWAEFFLPGAGWIPFDPNEMRGKGLAQKTVHDPWQGFGTIKKLNRRIPLSYHFVPPSAVESPQYAAVWGWDPRPGGDPSSEQIITFKMTSRGKGVEDPQ